LTDGSKFLTHVDIIEDAIFSVADGITVRLQDTTGTDVSHHWNAGDCVVSGRFARCENGPNGLPGRIYRAKFGTLPKQPSAVRSRFKLRGLLGTTGAPASIAPPFRGPVTVTLTYKPVNGSLLSRPGVVRDCIAGKSFLSCREP
jgi:hypothetical protein